jgi:hypothetical protein
MDTDINYSEFETVLLEKVRLSLVGKVSSGVLNSICVSVDLSKLSESLVVEFYSLLTGEKGLNTTKVYPIPWQDWGVSESQFSVLKQHCDPKYEEERKRLKGEVEILSERVVRLEAALKACEKVIKDQELVNRFMCFD